MYYPPELPRPQYQPPYSAYTAVNEEKQRLRRAANPLCLTVLAVLCCFLFFPSLFASFFNILNDGRTEYYGFSPLLYQFFSCAYYFACVGVPALLYFSIRHVNLNEAMPFHRVNPATAISAVLFGLAVCLLSNIPAGWVTNFETALGADTSTPPPYIDDSFITQAVFFTLMTVIPPLVEELLFRGAILSGLRPFGDGFAIVASSLLFGMFHGNFAQFVFAFFCGLAMSFLVVKTNCIWISVAIHFGNNALSTAISLTEYHFGESCSYFVYGVCFLSILLLGVLATVFLAFRDKNFFHLERRPSALRTSQKLGTVFGCAGGVLFLIFSGVLALAQL